MEIPEAPAGLSEKSRQLWILAFERDRRWGRDPGALRLTYLTEALFALDGAETARRQMLQTGLSVVSESGIVRVNPLAKSEKDFRAQFDRLWRELGYVNDYLPETNEFYPKPSPPVENWEYRIPPPPTEEEMNRFLGIVK